MKKITLVCDLITANKNSSSVRLSVPVAAGEPGKPPAQSALIIALQYADKNAGYNFLPGESYEITIEATSGV